MYNEHVCNCYKIWVFSSFYSLFSMVFIKGMCVYPGYLCLLSTSLRDIVYILEEERHWVLLLWCYPLNGQLWFLLCTVRFSLLYRKFPCLTLWWFCWTLLQILLKAGSFRTYPWVLFTCKWSTFLSTQDGIISLFAKDGRLSCKNFLILVVLWFYMSNLGCFVKKKKKRKKEIQRS